MIHQVPIKSLPQEWLWCETWCSDESKKIAKTIDLVSDSMIQLFLKGIDFDKSVFDLPEGEKLSRKETITSWKECVVFRFNFAKAPNWEISRE